MSHLPERSEKTCLNCNAAVNGRFCSVCGQENLVPQESVGHFIKHFFNDITHFDGKFFSSIKYLFSHPGFLAGEYVAGRRMSYINPIRFYVFTSAFFFLVYFGFLKSGSSSAITFNPARDSVAGNQPARTIIDDDTLKYAGLAAFDSAVKRGEVKGDAMSHFLGRVDYAMAELGSEKSAQVRQKLGSLFTKYLPYAFLITLPLFAAVLQLLYLRRRKQFYYVAHIVFALYLYAHAYLWVLLLTSMLRLKRLFDYWPMGILVGVMFLYYFYYLYKSFRIFYGQSRWKTVIKFLIQMIATLIIFFVAVIGLFFISLMYSI